MSEAVKPAGNFIFGPPPRGDNAGKPARAPSIFDGLLDRPAPRPGGEIPSPPARDRLDWSWGGKQASAQETTLAEIEAGPTVDEPAPAEDTEQEPTPDELPPDEPGLTLAGNGPAIEMAETEKPQEVGRKSTASQDVGGTSQTTEAKGERPRGDMNGTETRPVGLPGPDTAAARAFEAASRAGRAGPTDGATPAFARWAEKAEGRSNPVDLRNAVSAREPGQASQSRQHQSGSRLERLELPPQARFDRNDGDTRARAFDGRVTLVSSQTAQPAPPAPAAAQLMPGGTAAQVVSAIRDDGDPTWRTATAANQAQEALAARPRPLHSIQIQLNPAELGRVTARLSIAGAQLRVELLVETSQARTQLSNDSDAILKALKSSGYEIDRVTIQQAPQTANAGTPSGQERGTGSFSSTGGQAGETGEDRRWRGAEEDDGQRERGGDESIQQESAGGGIYI